MFHPYRELPPSSFWRRSVVGVAQDAFDPVTGVPWRIARGDAVATAGSCFAQHISRELARSGFHFLVTERSTEVPAAGGATAPATYSARYGNIYTTRQLLQLFERAYGLRVPKDLSWVRPDGRHVDPFRPREFADGFASADAVLAEQERHLAAVREAFETCNVFVFTLGLTEGWVATADGSAVPLAPNVVAAPQGMEYAFHNQDVTEMTDDLERFIAFLLEVNPQVRLVFTVSPVPLEATYEPRHVLLSTTWSKAALRVTAEAIVRRHAERAVYFPSYEMVTAFPHNTSFEADLRSVRPEVVAHVMSVFKRNFTLADATVAAAPRPVLPAAPAAVKPAVKPFVSEFSGVLCDEELLMPADRRTA